MSSRVGGLTVYLVRHASAGHRNDDDPSDLERHLDGKGRRQADAVAALLAHAAGDPGVLRLAASPAARCIETFEPLAERLGCEVEVWPDLLEGSSIDCTWSALAKAAEHDEHVALCSHGDVIPELISRLQGRGMRVPGPAGCSKGSVWTLTGWDGQRFETGTYTPV